MPKEILQSHYNLTKGYTMDTYFSTIKWISVKDQLPPLYHPILMWGPGGKVCSGFRSDGGDRQDQNGIWWPADEGGWYENDEVTLWAELPVMTGIQQQMMGKE